MKSLFFISSEQSFNSRAHKGRDLFLCRVGVASLVSIHAPTRGATNSARPIPCIPSTFQFTRPQGARLKDPIKMSEVMLFQFTRPQGARHVRLRASEASEVSIHAPTRGATYQHRQQQRAKKFQFTRPQGARLIGLRVYLLILKFQFTRPQGARQTIRYIILTSTCFNSRAHKGRDKQNC